MRRVPGLWSAAAALSVSGLALRLTPAALPSVRVEPPRATAPAPAPPAATAERTPTGYEGITAANVFALARAAPRERFTPPGLAKARAPTGPALRLYGITVTAQGAHALIDADPRIPGAEIYRVGDLVRGAVLTAITDSTVTLQQRSGPLVLRLLPASRRKP